MSNPITGLVHVTGGHDVGKTTFALTSGARAKKTGFVDADLKGANLVTQVGKENFGLYCDFVHDTAGMRELAIHQYGLSLIEQMKSKHLDVIVWDTWTAFGKTFHPYVAKNPNQFREFWSSMGQIKGGEQWQAAFQYEAQVIERLLDAAPLVILVTHLKDHRIGSVRTGKQIPDAQRTLDEKSNLRIWLHHNPVSPEPIGLILKRIELLKDTPQGLKPTNILPRKVTPCTWERLVWYWNNPLGNTMPSVEETPDEFELSILDGTLTPDQRKVFEAGLKEPEQDFGELTVDYTAEAKRLASEGKSKPEISKELGLSIVQVQKLLGGSNGSS